MQDSGRIQRKVEGGFPLTSDPVRQAHGPESIRQAHDPESFDMLTTLSWPKGQSKGVSKGSPSAGRGRRGLGFGRRDSGLKQQTNVYFVHFVCFVREEGLSDLSGLSRREERVYSVYSVCSVGSVIRWEMGPENLSSHRQHHHRSRRRGHHYCHRDRHAHRGLMPSLSRK